jgi:GNAT superfamily N-acetyltransferase
LCEESESRVAWFLRSESAKVGYAYLHLHGDDALIADLKVDDLIVRQTWWDRLLRRRPAIQGFRRRGLGTLLLKAAIARAREAGCVRICGEITHTDVAATPGLIAWYEREGFRFASLEGDLRLAGRVEKPLC